VPGRTAEAVVDHELRIGLQRVQGGCVVVALRDRGGRDQALSPDRGQGEKVVEDTAHLIDYHSFHVSPCQ